MHPDDLADRGIADGDTVTVSSRTGAVTVDVQATDDMMRGVTTDTIHAGLPLPNDFSGNHGKKPSSGRLFFQTKVLPYALPELHAPVGWPPSDQFECACVEP